MRLVWYERILFPFNYIIIYSKINASYVEYKKKRHRRIIETSTGCKIKNIILLLPMIFYGYHNTVTFKHRLYT